MRHMRKTVLLIAVAALLLAAAMPAAFAFPLTAGSGESVTAETYGDIRGSWFEDWAADYGYKEIFSGGDGLFHPERAVTRMEFVRLIHRALDINISYIGFAPTHIGEYFNDVDEGDVGAGDLYDLVTSGIIAPGGGFDPAGELERDEMIHVAMSAFYSIAGSDYAVPDISAGPFADDAEVGDGYRTDVKTARLLGLINGTGANLVSPRLAASRAEAVTVAGRLAELLRLNAYSAQVKASATEEGGALNMVLTVRNNTREPVTIAHFSGQKSDFVILDDNGNELYRWSQDKFFTMMVETTEIASGGEVSFSAVLDAQAYSAIRDDISAVKAYIVGTSSDFKINGDGYFAQYATTAA